MANMIYCGLACIQESGPGNGRYLVIRREASPLAADELSKLDIRMLERSAIPRTMPLDIEDVDSSVKLCYKLPLGRTLDQYVRDVRGGGLGMVLELLHAIATTLEDSRAYMLDEGKYALHPALIYVGRDSGDVSLAYLPVRTLENKRSVRQELYQLALLLMEGAEVDDRSCPLLLDCLRSSLFDLSGFRSLLIRLLADAAEPGISSRQEEGRGSMMERLGEEGSLLASGPLQAADSDSPAAPPLRHTPEKRKSMDFTAAAGAELLQGERLLHDGDTLRLHPKVWAKEPKVRLRLLLAVLILIWGAAAVWPAEESLSLCIGLTLVTAAYSYNKIRSGRKTVPREAEDPFAEMEPEEMRDEEGSYGFHPEEAGPGPSADRRPPPSRSFGWTEAERKLYVDTRAQTVFLMQPAETELLPYETELLAARAFLDIQHGGVERSIELSGERFVFGRSPEDTDWVLEAPGISRRHGAIERSGQEWSLTDLGSRNGCKLNGERLEPGRTYRLKDGDRIEAAQTELMFRVPC